MKNNKEFIHNNSKENRLPKGTSKRRHFNLITKKLTEFLHNIFEQMRLHGSFFTSRHNISIDNEFGVITKDYRYKLAVNFQLYDNLSAET